MKKLLMIACLASFAFSPTVALCQSQAWTWNLSGGGLAELDSVGSPTGLDYPNPSYVTFAMDADVSGTVVYAVDSLSELFGTIVPETGDFTAIGPLAGDFPTGNTTTGISVDPTNGAVYLSATDPQTGIGSLYIVNITDGVATFVADFTPTSTDVPDLPVDIAIDNFGNMYMFDFDSSNSVDNGRLWSVDKSNGNVVLLGTSGLDDVGFAQGMDFDPDTNILYSAIFGFDGANLLGDYGSWNLSTPGTATFMPLFALSDTGDFTELEITIFDGTTYCQNLLDGGVWAKFDVDNLFTYTTLNSPTPNIWCLDWDSTGTNLYGIDRTTNILGTFDTSTAEFLPIAPISGDFFTGLQVAITCDDSTGQFYLISSVDLYTLDVSTGVTELIGSFTGGGGLVVEGAAANGELYVIDSNADALFQCDLSDASLTLVGNFGLDIGGFVQGCDFDPTTGKLFCATYTEDDLTLAPLGSYGSWDLSTNTYVELTPLQDITGRNVESKQLKLAIRATPGPIEVAPESIEVTRGSYISGGTLEASSSDNADFRARRNTSDIQARVDLEIISVSPTQSPSSFSFSLEGSVFSRSSVNQTIQFFDYDAGVYVDIDTTLASRFMDITQVGNGTGDLSRFVDDETSEVKTRIRFLATTARNQYSTNTDQTIWLITP